MAIKDILYQVTPPILWKGLRSVRQKLRVAKKRWQMSVPQKKVDSQDLGLYWDSKMAAILETWGQGNAWTEIELLMANCRGKILDIACGPGKTIELLKGFVDLEVHGCDISDFLIKKAQERGIPSEHLKVCDATKTGYADDTFDYSYSIGSLEHFTEDGIDRFIEEAHRITRCGTFHMIPISKSGKDEGWIKPYQSYYNNSLDWWQAKFGRVYKKVYVIESRWEDDFSWGRWMVCFK